MYHLSLLMVSISVPLKTIKNFAPNRNLSISKFKPLDVWKIMSKRPVISSIWINDSLASLEDLCQKIVESGWIATEMCVNVSNEYLFSCTEAGGYQFELQLSCK